MNNFYISLSPKREDTAWYKAISDVEYFLNSMDFKPIPIQCCINNAENGLQDFLSPEGHQEDQDNTGMILLQYPRILFEGLNLSTFTDYMKINYKNYKLIALVHDLDSIRFGDFSTTNYLAEVSALNQFDYLITVNDAMSSLLKEHGAVPEIYALTIFDYVLENKKNVKLENNQNNTTIAFAGNLKYEKSQFIYELAKVDFKNIIINLYGPYLNNDQFCPSENIHYKGSFPSDDLPNEINDGFGLCWDGNSLDRCGGKHGEYFKYSNPHKVSLYLAMGIPVIISKDISTFAFIEKEHAGITIDTLYDIPAKLNNISNEEYKLLQENALKISERLRNGYYIKHAINNIEENIQSKL